MPKHIITPEKLITEVLKLEPRDRVIYYEGSFIADRVRYPKQELPITVLLETAQELEEASVVLLASRHMFETISRYYIIRAISGIVPSDSLYRNVARRMKELEEWKLLKS